MKILLCISGLVLLSLSMGFAQSGKAIGPEAIYGAPAEGLINTFPVMVINRETGGFTDVFNVTAPPPFLCSGGETAVGSRFLYVTVPAGSCNNQFSELIGYSLDQATGVPSALEGSPFLLPAGASPNGMATAPTATLFMRPMPRALWMPLQRMRRRGFRTTSKGLRSKRAQATIWWSILRE